MTTYNKYSLALNLSAKAQMDSVDPDTAKKSVQTVAHSGLNLQRRRLLNIFAAGISGASAWPVAAQSGTQKTVTSATNPRSGVALVLGSGGCRGHAHIGLIRVLEASDLRPDMVVGTSAGSLVGALYAAGLGASELERYGGQMDSEMMRDWKIPHLGMFGGNRISQFVNARVGRRSIESLRTRYAAVTTDLRSGELVTLDRGDLATAVQASSSAPGLVEPVVIGHRLCVDGSLVAPVPVMVARSLGARFIIACDVSFPPREAILEDPFDALYQGFSILTRRLALEQRAEADLVIAPRIPEHNDMKPATVTALIAAGEAAARQSLPAIRRLLKRAG